MEGWMDGWVGRVGRREGWIDRGKDSGKNK